MKNTTQRQKGGSAIGTLIILVVFAYGIFIGIQYVPQVIESRSIDSILNDMKDAQRTDPVNSEQIAKEKVVRMLQLNEMNDMTDSFTVRKQDGRIKIMFNYDRELNLIFKTQPIHYEQSVQLN